MLDAEMYDPTTTSELTEENVSVAVPFDHAAPVTVSAFDVEAA